MIGHALRLSGDLRAFFTQQYLKHGPVFEVKALGRTLVVLAGQEANLFMIREGKSHLRNREFFAGFSHEMGAANVVMGMDGAEHHRLRQTMRDGYSRAQYLRKMSDRRRRRGAGAGPPAAATAHSTAFTPCSAS